jgi:hypothetical protein
MESVNEILEAEGTSVEELGIQETYSYEGENTILRIEHMYGGKMDVREYDIDDSLLNTYRPKMKFDDCQEGDWTPYYYRDDRHDLVKGTRRNNQAIIDDLTELMHQWDDLLQYRFPAQDVVD